MSVTNTSPKSLTLSTPTSSVSVSTNAVAQIDRISSTTLSQTPSLTPLRPLLSPLSVSDPRYVDTTTETTSSMQLPNPCAGSPFDIPSVSVTQSDSSPKPRTRISLRERDRERRRGDSSYAVTFLSDSPIRVRNDKHHQTQTPTQTQTQALPFQETSKTHTSTHAQTMSHLMPSSSPLSTKSFSDSPYEPALWGTVEPQSRLHAIPVTADYQFTAFSDSPIRVQHKNSTPESTRRKCIEDLQERQTLDRERAYDRDRDRESSPINRLHSSSTDLDSDDFNVGHTHTHDLSDTLNSVNLESPLRSERVKKSHVVTSGRTLMERHPFLIYCVIAILSLAAIAFACYGKIIIAGVFFAAHIVVLTLNLKSNQNQLRRLQNSLEKI